MGREPGLLDAFCQGYESSGQSVPKRDARRELVLDAVKAATRARWWWDTFGVLHPRTPDDLDGVLGSLEALVHPDG